MLLVDSLEELKPARVLSQGGKLVAENGQLVAEIEDRSYPLEQKNTMFVKDLTVEDFKIWKAPVQEGTVKVNAMEYQDLLLSSTLQTVLELPVRDGCVQLTDDTLKICWPLSKSP